MTDSDRHLDNILKASGSGLRNYSMQKTIDDMRKALNAAIAEEIEACAKFFDDNDTNIFWGSEAARFIRARGEQA